MNSLSISPRERSRKAYAMVLQALSQNGTAVAIAATLGVSEATISRTKNDHCEQVLDLICALGLKVVPVEYVCVKPEVFNAVAVLSQAMVRQDDFVKQLSWED